MVSVLMEQYFFWKDIAVREIMKYLVVAKRISKLELKNANAMKNAGIAMPGYRVFEYLLVLNPHQELSRKIAEIRKDFYKEYKVTGVPSAKANLALVKFEQLEMAESRIVQKLHIIALGYPPFKVEIKDFGSFPSHTIYLNVTSKVPIQNLVKTIRSEAQRLMKFDPEKTSHFMLEPHFTIGMKLKPWQYEKGWLAYSNKHFTGKFIADEMILLKRLSSERNWQVASRFKFQNLPVLTKQGELF
jgi:2'-5' RNA ligase